MALTLVFVIACLAFGAHGKGLHHKLAKPEVCTGQQEACLYCESLISFAHGTIDDDGFESALVAFGTTICSLMDAASPEYKECVGKIKTVPQRARQLADTTLADPQALCSFVCPSNNPISNMCLNKAPAMNDCGVKPTASSSDACIICKGVPQFVKQLLTGDGFLALLEKFLLTDCDIIAPGCEKDMCEDHTKFLSTKIKFFVSEFMNPETGCSFVCEE